MNIRQLYNKACCVMQWSIGLSKGSIEQIIRDKKSNLAFKWVALSHPVKSIADPFLLKDPAGNLNILYEDFSMIDNTKYGRIMQAGINKQFDFTDTKEILDAKSHSSYPFVFTENNKTYIIPETGAQRKVSVYEYDFVSKTLVNEKVIINGLPLLDATIFTYNEKYWLFAELSDQQFGKKGLHIYYADSLLGTYQPHPNNPVKYNLDGSRPAGNMITVDGELYRPTQNCKLHYGESISINRITRLTENEFAEEFDFRLAPDKSGGFNSGIHTINVVDDVIVIDGIKMLFKPITKLKLFIKKKRHK